MTDKKLMSETISALRFPLMVGVVFIHFNISEGMELQSVVYGTDMPSWFVYMVNLLSDVLPSVGVPLFFLMSGYLFFRSGLTADAYKSKLKKRARTLLVPYLLWNTIAFLYVALRFLPCFDSLHSKTINIDWSIWRIVACYWNGRLSPFADPDAIIEPQHWMSPIDPPMWYVRDLMIMMLLAPLFYFLIKKAGWYAVVFFGVAWYIIHPYPLGHICYLLAAAFFFSWGACYAVRGIDFVASMRSFRLAPWLFVPLAVVDMVTKDQAYSLYIHNIAIVLGIFTAVSLTATLLERGRLRVNKFLADASFFLFALHMIFIADVGKVITKLMFVDSPWFMTALYFCVPIITITICLSLYWLLRRYAPSLCALLTGGR